MNRAPWVRRKLRYEREARERSHAEFEASINRLRNLTEAELAVMVEQAKRLDGEPS